MKITPKDWTLEPVELELGDKTYVMVEVDAATDHWLSEYNDRSKKNIDAYLSGKEGGLKACNDMLDEYIMKLFPDVTQEVLDHHLKEYAKKSAVKAAITEQLFAGDRIKKNATNSTKK